MNKRFLVLVLALALALPALYADIGENFAKGGVGLGGSVSYFNNFYYFLDEAEDRSYWSLEIAPELNFFLAYRVALTLAPWFSYESMKYDASNVEKSLGWGVTVGGYYAFVRDPSAQAATVLTLGGSLGLGFYPSLDDRIGGVDTPSTSMSTLMLTFTPRVYFFLNDRLAPYLGLTPRLGYVLSYKDGTGTSIPLTGRERVVGSLTATLGMSFFIPNAKAAVFGRGQVR